MDVFIYFHSPLPDGRDVFEDAIEERLKGQGEVSGGGSGERGTNIDLRVFDDETDVPLLLATLKDVLRDLNAPSTPRSTSKAADIGWDPNAVARSKPNTETQRFRLVSLCLCV